MTRVSQGSGNTFLDFNPFTDDPDPAPVPGQDEQDLELGLGPRFGNWTSVRSFQIPRRFHDFDGRPFLDPSCLSCQGAGARPRLLFFRGAGLPFAGEARFLLCALALAVFAALATGCARRSKPAESFPNAPVVLISVDTLRSDHLPFYGYAGVETPALSALREDSILFSNAWSQVPLTLPSHASILTGRLPGDHGIHDNLGYLLRKDVPTIAELLKKQGYATGAAISCYVLKARQRDRAGLRPLRRRRRLRRGAPLPRAGAAGRPRDREPAGEVGGRTEGRGAVLRLPSPLRASHPLRAARAVQEPVREGPLRRRDRHVGRARGALPRRPEAAGNLRPGAHRLPLGPRRGARRARGSRARDVPLPRGAPGAAPRQAPRVAPG